MANVLPKSIVARIQWGENHTAAFTTNAVAIGITSAIATEFATKTAAARAALQARDLAEETARNRNNDLRIAMDAYDAIAAGIIKAVKGKADMVGDSVYSLASIPVPAHGSPRPAPGTPTDFTVQLQQTGAITLNWECDNSGNAGTQYYVWRRIDGETSFTGMGGTGQREFVDATIPAGSKVVTYQIQATRSTGGGAFGEFNVNFGVSTGGALSANVAKAA